MIQRTAFVILFLVVGCGSGTGAGSGGPRKATCETAVDHELALAKKEGLESGNNDRSTLIQACQRSQRPQAVLDCATNATTWAEAYECSYIFHQRQKRDAIAAWNASDLVTRLAWLPADTEGIGGFKVEAAPMVQFYRSAAGKPPACVDRAIASLDTWFQVVRSLDDRALQIVHGGVDLEREAIERCLVDMFEGAWKLTIKRDGAISEITRDDGKRTHLGWTNDGYILWHDDRARIEAALARKTSLKDNPELVALLRRVDAAKPMWFAASIDVTARTIGVPSRGFFLVLEIPEKRPPVSDVRVPASIVFASREEAVAADRAFRAALESPSLPEPVKRMFADMKPAVDGSDLVVNVAALFKDAEGGQALLELLRKPR